VIRVAVIRDITVEFAVSTELFIAPVRDLYKVLIPCCEEFIELQGEAECSRCYTHALSCC
jgi:hypothetical protein